MAAFEVLAEPFASRCAIIEVRLPVELHQEGVPNGFDLGAVDVREQRSLLGGKRSPHCHTAGKPLCNRAPAQTANEEATCNGGADCSALVNQRAAPERRT